MSDGTVIVAAGQVPSSGIDGMRGKKALPKKNRPKRTVEMEFKPNSFQPVVDLATFRAPNEYHTFDHVPDGFELLANDASSILMNVSASRYPGLHDQAFMDEANVRMANILLSKKLAMTAKAPYDSVHYEDFKLVKNVNLQVPSFASVFADGYGTFSHDSAEFTPRNLPLHVFAHFARACNMPVDGLNPNHFAVNTLMTDWSPLLRSFLCNRVDKWIEKQDLVNVTVAGTVLSSKIPSPSNTIPLPPGTPASYQALGLVVPLEVIADLELIIAIDGLPMPVPFVIPPAPFPAVALAAGIHLFRWNSIAMGNRINHYITNYEVKMTSVWATVYKVEHVKKMDEYGKAWQLVDVSEELINRSHLNLSKTDIAIAHALDVAEHRVRFEAQQMRSTASTKTPRMTRIELLRKGMITTEFQ